MYYVGLDVHFRTTSVCILDGNGKRVKHMTIKGNWHHLMSVLKKEVPKSSTVCFEASCGYGWLHEELSKITKRVVMAHPGQLRLIFRSKRKSDRVDAEKLAKLLYLDEVPTAYVPSVPIRRWRETIEFRQRTVGKRVRTKNAIRALLRGNAIVARRNLWSAKGVAWLSSLELADELASVRLWNLLEELSLFDKQIARVTGLLDKLAKDHPAVALLKTIPGVGPRTSEVIAAYVADPARFNRLRQVGAYFGLVPCQDSSAGANRLGHITREGPATARKMLVEAAWQVIRRDASVRQRFERLTQGKQTRRKIAVVAVAHHLACCMVSMLKTGEAWRQSA